MLYNQILENGREEMGVAEGRWSTKSPIYKWREGRMDRHEQNQFVCTV